MKGLVLIGEDGVRKSKFPRGCEASPGVRAATAAPTASRGRGKENDDVLSRLCNPKLYTGTAATGHLPQVVDLEGGAGVSRGALRSLFFLWFRTPFYDRGA